MAKARPYADDEVFESSIMPYQFRVLQINDMDELFYWCFDHFGSHGGSLPQRYFITNSGDFYFSRHDDAIEFKMRWC
jgi:hypothetical protein